MCPGGLLLHVGSHFCTYLHCQTTEVFNENFLQFVLGLIEHDAETEEQEQISEQAASLLLSFNLHFPKGSGDNLVMRVLSGTTPRQLNQKVMLLMNKDEDPVAVFLTRA